MPLVQFPSTVWEDIENLKSENAAVVKQAMESLLKRYEYPIEQYFKIRFRNHPLLKNEIDSIKNQTLADLSVGKGAEHLRSMTSESTPSFRAWLLKRIKWAAQSVERTLYARQSSHIHGAASLNELQANQDSIADEADTAYDRAFVESTLREVDRRLKARCDHPQYFDILKPYVRSDSTVPYADLCAQTGLRKEQLYGIVHKFRELWKVLLREIVLETVGSPSEVERELLELMRQCL
ncbi:hypothetical protein [Tuwongella immobilis]|uniref:Uncharacterized protein n=1 Tax=Tuwongella immobilis TaxID=692036 RepID=A0A6C2YWJ8_9BACT|nr:hypothetical protein [Tuwongella immobilis]VIP05523.1 unnamed protein product [Tuwongella immobilis]VTS08402.1 unnamed protein product [Tuwongella immobilis]